VCRTVLLVASNVRFCLRIRTHQKHGGISDSSLLCITWCIISVVDDLCPCFHYAPGSGVRMRSNIVCSDDRELLSQKHNVIFVNSKGKSIVQSFQTSNTKTFTLRTTDVYVVDYNKYANNTK